MMPIYGLDLGKELGSIDARLAQHDKEFTKIEARLDALDAKFEAKIDALDAKFETKINALDTKIGLVDARVDKCLVAINRLDERTKNLSLTTGGILAAVVAGLVLQFLFR